MTSDVDLARGIFRTLDGLPPDALRTFAAGLELADGRPVRWVAQPIRYFASDRDGGGQDPSPLSTITMVSAIRKTAAEGSLLSRLADARQPFWVAVADALVAVAADRLPVDA